MVRSASRVVEESGEYGVEMLGPNSMGDTEKVEIIGFLGERLPMFTANSREPRLAQVVIERRWGDSDFAVKLAETGSKPGSSELLLR